MTTRDWEPDSKSVRQVYDKLAAGYSDASVVAREIARRLNVRLDYLAIEPKHVLDIGVGTGESLPSLYKRYPKAAVTGMDISLPMLLQVNRRRSLFRKARLVQSDAGRLPFPDQSLDLVTAGMMLFLVPDPFEVFQEINRVLKPSGALLYSTLGPDSFKTVLKVLHDIDSRNVYIGFPDMHDIGDAMARAGLAQPVLDTEHLNITYPGVEAMLSELCRCGGVNVAEGRRKGLMGRDVPFLLRRRLEELGVHNLDIELIQGHAWKGEQRFGAGIAESPLPERYIPVLPDISN